jgi:hypothetical protein
VKNLNEKDQHKCLPGINCHNCNNTMFNEFIQVIIDFKDPEIYCSYGCLINATKGKLGWS